ncbi:MAG: FtsB family cell division protein [bacterium]
MSDENENIFQNKFIFTLLLGAIVISATIILFAHSADHQLDKIIQQRKQLKKENKRLEKRAEELAIRQKRLQEDPYLIQKLAREKLGLSRPGEKKIWLPRSNNFFDTSARGNSSPDSTTIFD